MATVESITSLIVAGVEIFQDDYGRYNLNDLHRGAIAVGILPPNDQAKIPGAWIKRKSTKELISELKTQMANMTFDVVKGGNAPGVYAHELLAISYAGWINPAFQLKVNQAFIDMRTGHILPKVINPTNQAMISMIVRQDQMEQEILSMQDRERHRDQALIAQQAEIIKSLQQGERAEAKADMALDDANRMTIEEFISRNGLLRQFPEHTWSGAYGWLSKFCQEWNLKITKDADTPWKSWPRENRYPMQALMAWVRATTRKRGQIRLDGIEEDGVSYDTL